MPVSQVMSAKFQGGDAIYCTRLKGFDKMGNIPGTVCCTQRQNSTSH